MTEGIIKMSRKELDRLKVIQAIAGKQITQVDAATTLGLTHRQVKRLVRSYKELGPSGLVSRRRGKRPGNSFPDCFRKNVLELIREKYRDFGPTFAAEKLMEIHQMKLCAETLRKWMIADGLWAQKVHRKARIHQRRLRRPCFGELVQIDGSPHDWFEGRGARCCLIVFIDDSTSRLMAIRFVTAETTRAYMETLNDYLNKFGRPVAIYSDKHSIFRVNLEEHEGAQTQFSRALSTLDIEAIHANSPQAKGRVERVNRTLQDRLVKEMRLQNISDIETANKFLPTFMGVHNGRFSVPPSSSVDAHRKVYHRPAELALILCEHHVRKLSKNLSIQFQNREFQIVGHGNGYRMRGAAVTVCRGYDEKVTILQGGKPLAYRILREGERPNQPEDDKTVHKRVEMALKAQSTQVTRKPAPDHPWRSYSIAKKPAGAMESAGNPYGKN